MTVVVGTAGHIDHGKTTLLRALTGIDADRLPEERRRGMTIDVGYAHLALPDGSELDFVDVPGHDRLVGNMLVGAGEVDAALLVVAADDGPRAQTLEHLELLDALGIRDGLAVVTKADAVDDARAAEVAAATARLLARTSLAGAPVVVVSATTGRGLDGLREALLALRDRLAGRDAARGAAAGPARLAIDRVFAIRGRGLVATGTLRGGGVERGTTLRLVPGDGRARVREVQVHGRVVERATGGRTALNLAGVEASALRRGTVLVTAASPVEASDRLLVALRPAAALAGEPAAMPAGRARIRLHVGTEQVGAVVGRRGRDTVELPNGESTAILRLDRPVAIAVGDRFVLRRPSPGRTLAGGRVLDAAPPRGAARRRTDPNRLAALAAAATPAALEDARLGLHGALAGPPPRLAADVTAAVRDELVRLAGAAGGSFPLATAREAVAGLLRRLTDLPAAALPAAVAAALEEALAGDVLARDGDRLRDPRRAPVEPAPEVAAAVAAAMDRLEAALAVPAPPPLADAARAAGAGPDAIRALEEAGRIVRLADDLAWAAPAYRDLEARALELAQRAPLAPAVLRDATGTSRKYVMAILEDLDRRGVLRRTPAGHVPGPRAPQVARLSGADAAAEVARP